MSICYLSDIRIEFRKNRVILKLKFIIQEFISYPFWPNADQILKQEEICNNPS